MSEHQVGSMINLGSASHGSMKAEKPHVASHHVPASTSAATEQALISIAASMKRIAEAMEWKQWHATDAESDILRKSVTDLDRSAS